MLKLSDRIKGLTTTTASSVLVWDYSDGIASNIRCEDVTDGSGEVEGIPDATAHMSSLEILAEHLGEDNFILGHWEVSDIKWAGFLVSLASISEHIEQDDRRFVNDCHEGGLMRRVNEETAL